MRVVRIVFLLVVLGLMGAIGASTDFSAVKTALNAKGISVPDIPVPQRLQDLTTRSGATAQAALPASLDKSELAKAVTDWVRETGVTGFTLAITQNGTLVADAGLGTRPKGAAQPVASLSKAVTAVCLQQVLSAHGLTWSATIDDLSEVFEALHILPGQTAQNITLAQIVTHQGGLAPDLIKGEMAGKSHGSAGLHVRYAWKALKDDGIQGTAGTYFYSNTNYAVLGAVIEGLEGRPYETVCMERVLVPAGITTARLNGRLGSMSSYAGWEISAADYARFYNTWFGPEQPWVINPDDYASSANGYGLGVFVTGTGRAAQITHDGRMCGSPGYLSFGATARKLPGGITYVATWDKCLEPPAYRALDAALAKALP